MADTFRSELTHIINKYSIGVSCDIPDAMLADYLVKCFENLVQATIRRRLPPVI